MGLSQAASWAIPCHDPAEGKQPGTKQGSEAESRNTPAAAFPSLLSLAVRQEALTFQHLILRGDVHAGQEENEELMKTTNSF